MLGIPLLAKIRGKGRYFEAIYRLETMLIMLIQVDCFWEKLVFMHIYGQWS